MVWAIYRDYGFLVVEVTRETEKTVFYKSSFNGRETRSPKTSFLDWRGDKETALSAVEKLKSAQSEMNRRKRAASDWYVTRQDEILASLPQA